MVDQNKTLTSRQKEILSLLRKGLTNVEICKALNISANTVKVHLANIYRILEVTNRTEAVSMDLEGRITNPVGNNDILLAIVGGSALDAFPLAKSLFFSIEESLHRYHLFCIRDSVDNGRAPTYRIQVSVAQNGGETLFLKLYKGDSSEVLWSASQKVMPNDDIPLLAAQNAIRLFRHMMISAAEVFEKDAKASPQWWYASCFAQFKTESISGESFMKASNALEPFTREKDYHVYAACSLVLMYYVAINESWVDAETFVPKIGDLACTGMRKNPYSAYAHFMMAVYNIIVGNKSDATAYFLQILDALPQDCRSRRMLAQIYMLTGKENEALQQLDESERYIPESAGQPNLSAQRAFIYFMQGKYDKAEEISSQVLLFHPETPLTRLILIACNNKNGKLKESRENVKKFFKYHPNFKKSDLEKLLTGIEPSKNAVILESVSNVFQ